MLKEDTLFGKVDKIKDAIKRIRKYCKGKNNVVVAFSGGKDSLVCMDLVKQAKIKFESHYNVTTVDPPELVKFIKDIYP